MAVGAPEEREFAYIHEHNFDAKMWSIAGKVDFLGLMEAGAAHPQQAPAMNLLARKAATSSRAWPRKLYRG